MAEPGDASRYAETFDRAPIARLITDRHGLVREANRAACALLEAEAIGLTGKPLAMFVPGDDRRWFRDRLTAAAKTTEPMTWTMWLRPRTGPAFHAEVHVVGSTTERGDLHWALTDVTERMATEQELRLLTAELEARVAERTREAEAERARLAAVVDQIPVGLTISGADGEVVLTNAEARRLLGDDDLGGLAVSNIVEDGRAEIVRSNGSHVVLEVAVAPIVDATGARVGAMHLFHDVSEREVRERAEREFVTNAAHQLQSPLAAILSAIEVLQSGAKDGPERDMFLGHIEREANRLARLARALLVLARVQTGFEAPKDEVVSLAPLLEEIAATARPVAGVRVEIECDEATAVVTNRELVEQALLNVLDNAAKYTKEGRITIAAGLSDGAAEIVVSDTGPGISPEEQSLVLGRFYRAAPDASDGFGLGFAIVRSAMEALGGDLAIESAPGAGTTVRLRLPQPALVVAT